MPFKFGFPLNSRIFFAQATVFIPDTQRDCTVTFIACVFWVLTSVLNCMSSPSPFDKSLAGLSLPCWGLYLSDLIIFIYDYIFIYSNDWQRANLWACAFEHLPVEFIKRIQKQLLSFLCLFFKETLQQAWAACFITLLRSSLFIVQMETWWLLLFYNRSSHP